MGTHRKSGHLSLAFTLVIKFKRKHLSRYSIKTIIRSVVLPLFGKESLHPASYLLITILINNIDELLRSSSKDSN